MPGASRPTSASPATAAITIVTCGEKSSASAPASAKPSPCSEISPAVVDAEDAPEQVLRRDLEDQRVEPEDPRAREARDDQQRERDGQGRLDREEQQRHERGRREHADQAHPPGGRHEPDRDQLAGDRPRRNRCEPPARSRCLQAEVGHVRGGEASGATAQVGTSQPSSSTRRTRGLASTADMPASESASTLVRCAGSTSPPSGGRERVPRRTTSAEPAKLAQSISSAPRGEESAIRRPPAPLPTTCADWRRSGRASDPR